MIKDTPESLIELEYKQWRKNIKYMYDLVYTNVLNYPSPSIQFFPDVQKTATGTVQRLLSATFTSGAEQEKLIINKVGFPDLIDEDVLGNADISFEQTLSIPVSSEINKARFCPQAPNIIACKTEDSDILIYDYTTHSSFNCSNGPDLILPGHSDGGFALDWNPNNYGEFISGGRDNIINIFNINSGLVKSYSDIHNSIINDLSFSCFNPYIFSSVSDDKKLNIIDIRSSVDCLCVKNAHSSTIEAVDFSPLKSELIATSSSDCSVKIWDKRSLSKPLIILRGHKNDVLSVKWSPHYESIIGSGSKDRRIILWDLNKSDISSSTGESSEMLFVHGGHTNSIDDFDWNPAEPMEIASVSSDGVLNIWKVPIEEYI